MTGLNNLRQLVTRFHSDERGDYAITSVAVFGAVILPLATAFYYGQEALADVYDRAIALVSMPYP